MVHGNGLTNELGQRQDTLQSFRAKLEIMSGDQGKDIDHCV